ncbi:hypothetical protein Tco_0320884 [Tanacetum coccineum]
MVIASRRNGNVRRTHGIEGVELSFNVNLSLMIGEVIQTYDDAYNFPHIMFQIYADIRYPVVVHLERVHRPLVSPVLLEPAPGLEFVLVFSPLELSLSQLVFVFVPLGLHLVSTLVHLECALVHLEYALVHLAI